MKNPRRVRVATAASVLVGWVVGFGLLGATAALADTQTITFTSSPPSPAAYGGTYTPAATGGGSGNPVTFSIDSSSDPGACSYDSMTGVVSFTGLGSCVVDANQAAGGIYSAAPQEQQSVTITQASQTISFTSSPPAPAAYGGSYTPAATGGGSGNAVTFSIDSSSDPGACSYDSMTGIVSFTGVGSCVIDANQAGSTDYSAAAQVQQPITITQATLSVNAADGTEAFGQSGSFTYSLSGFVNGEDAVSAGVSGQASCSAAPSSPNVGTYANAITCSPGTLSATNYTFTTGSGGTLTITKAAQTISFLPVVVASGANYGLHDFRPARASSRMPEVYSAPSGDCTIDSGGLVHLTGAGTCTVTVNQSGSADYLAAPTFTGTFVVGPATLHVNALGVSVRYGTTPTLRYRVSGFVNGDTPTSASLTGSGSCSIASGTSTDAGTYPGAISCAPGTLSAPNYTVVQGTSSTLTIVKLAQTIRYSTHPLSPKYAGTYTVGATGGGSGSSVVFSIDPSSAGVCSLSGGNVVSFSGVGSCIIDANQAGSTNYLSAPLARQSFRVGRVTLTVAANSAVRPYGSSNPSLTATIYGFVPGEDLATSGVTGSPSCSTSAGPSSPRGNYAIVCSLGTLSSAHYSFAFLRGTLSVV